MATSTDKSLLDADEQAIYNQLLLQVRLLQVFLKGDNMLDIHIVIDGQNISQIFIAQMLFIALGDNVYLDLC